MPSLLRQLRRFLSRPQGVVIAICVAVCTLFVLSIGWLEATKVARRKVSEQVTRLQKRLGFPVEIGRLTIGIGGAHFDDVRIGPDANIVVSRVTAEVGLNPFNDSFGELDTVTIYRVRVKSPLSTVQGSMKTLSEKTLAEGPGSTAERSLEKLFQALPTKKLVLKSGGLTIVSDDNQPLVVIKGLEVQIERTARRALFKIESVKGPEGVFERNIQGRLELSPKSKGYRFFVRRKLKAGEKPNAWAISGELAKDLGEVKGQFQINQVPSVFLKPLASVLGDRPRARLKGAIKATKENNSWRYTARVSSSDTRIQMPLLSSKSIGPVRFEVSAVGSVRPDDRVFAIESAKIVVPARNGKSLETTPIRFDVSGALRLSTFATTSDGSEGRGLAFQGRMQLPPTNCQAVLDAAPSGLLPALEDFKLSGTIEGGIAFNYDSVRPDGSVFELDQPRFDCHVTAEPYTYSGEHLSGPFTLQREMNKGDEPIELRLTPETPGFTPLSQIAASVNAAFVASEDAAFFSHHGIDTAALESAVRTNFREGRVKVGGSTITMQTVKNLFLTPERTVSRKLQELFLAWHLENVLSKERILEIYMNIAELGPGIFGITQASETYFGKSPFDLTLLESAYIANLLPSPKKRYQYFCAGQMTPTFTGMVHGLLKRMLNLNRITYERYAEAVGRDLQFYEPARAAARDCPKTGGTWNEEETP